MTINAAMTLLVAELEAGEGYCQFKPQWQDHWRTKAC